MTSQTWTMASKLAAMRASELQGLASRRARPGCGNPQAGVVARAAGRALVAAGWRLGGTHALPGCIRRRLA